MRWLRPALLMAGLVGAGWLLQRVGLSAAVARAGERGPLVFLGVAAAACAVGVPRQVVAYAGGWRLGFGLGRGWRWRRRWPGVRRISGGRGGWRETGRRG